MLLVWDEVARIVEAVASRAPGELLSRVSATLEVLVSSLASMLGQVPSPVVALVVGMVTWRRAGLISGMAAAFATGLLGLSRLWPQTLETVAHGLVGVLLAVPALLATVALARAGRRQWETLMLRRPMPPGIGVAVALPVAVALAALAKPLAGSGVNLAWVVTIGVTIWVLCAPSAVRAGIVYDGPGGLANQMAHSIAVGIGVGLLLGLIGGFGLGGAVDRAIAGGDIAGAADAAVSTLLLTIVIVSSGAWSANDVEQPVDRSTDILPAAEAASAAETSGKTDEAP